MIVIDTKLDKSLYLQIYEQIGKKIISGEIEENTRLPSIKTLAHSLNVSKNTVNNAYQQLCAEGFITSRIRSGFYSRKIEGNLLSNSHFLKPTETCELLGQKNTSSDTPILKYNFQYGYQLSANNFPINVWRRITNQLLSSSNLDKMTSYSDPAGEKGLRLELMKYLRASRGVNCHWRQIIICSGTQYCLNLICQFFKDKADQIAMEDPGYDGARDVFINNGFDVKPIGLLKDGVNINELEATRAKLIYTTPSHQFPTGTVMSIQNRIELLTWAKKNDSYILEDDYDSELRYTGRPIPSIQGIDNGGSVIYLGTLSKSLSPAIRISYMVLPEVLLEGFWQKFRRYASSVAWLEQSTLELFIHGGYWERHLRKVCLSNKRKLDLLNQTISGLMGESVTIHGKNSGLHIILEVDNGLSEDELISRAKEHGVVTYPVSAYWIRRERYRKNCILLGFSGMTENDIASGIQRLFEAWFKR